MLAPLGEAIRAIGTPRFDMAFHAAVAGVAPSAHMTIMRYPDHGSPQALVISSTRAKPLIEALTSDYVRRYYRLDPHFAALAQPGPSSGARVLRRRSSDFSESYRRHFFASSHVADKISIVWRAAAGWDCINLYATFDHGCYSELELEQVAAMAPVLAGAAGRHAELMRGSAPDVSAMAKAIGTRRGVRFTRRELQVATGILEGASTRGIAEALGIAPSSVHTFRKILYRKLGVASQAELFSLALAVRAAGVTDRSPQ